MSKDTSLPPYVYHSDKVILFDGVCVLCHAWAQFMIRHDVLRQFKLATVQSTEGQAILAFYGMPTDHFETMVLVEGANVFTHSTAFIRVVMRLGLPWRLAAIAWIIPKPLRDQLYRLIANNRYRIFGQYAHCMMPQPDHQARFLVTKQSTTNQ